MGLSCESSEEGVAKRGRQGGGGETEAERREGTAGVHSLGTLEFLLEGKDSGREQ